MDQAIVLEIPCEWKFVLHNSSDAMLWGENQFSMACKLYWSF